MRGFHNGFVTDNPASRCRLCMYGARSRPTITITDLAAAVVTHTVHSLSALSQHAMLLGLFKCAQKVVCTFRVSVPIVIEGIAQRQAPREPIPVDISCRAGLYQLVQVPLPAGVPAERHGPSAQRTVCFIRSPPPCRLHNTDQTQTVPLGESAACPSLRHISNDGTTHAIILTDSTSLLQKVKTCVNVRIPTSKNPVGVLSWTCRSQRK